ncbi:hypothetical protein NFI96_027399, partial [Prochilodus magdalenae]
MKRLTNEDKRKLRRAHASNALKARSYIGWLRQARCRFGGIIHAMKRELERLDKKNKTKSKFSHPHWPPVISMRERESRKKLRRELAQAAAAQASKADPPPQKSTAQAGLSQPLWLCCRLHRLCLWQQWKECQGLQSGGDRKDKRRTIRCRRRVAQSIAGTTQSATPCKLCGQPKRLEFGHSYYRGKSFCAKAAGRSVSDWLAEQKRAAGQDQGRTMPRTTAWRLKKRLQQEKADRKAGIVPKYRKRAPFAICHLCDQPRQKAYGHSRYKGIPFCSSHEGKTVELWLAEQRAADREERPGTSGETAK